MTWFYTWVGVVGAAGTIACVGGMCASIESNNRFTRNAAICGFVAFVSSFAAAWGFGQL